MAWSSPASECRMGVDPDVIDWLCHHLFDPGPPTPESFQERYPIFCSVFAPAEDPSESHPNDQDPEDLELALDDLVGFGQVPALFRDPEPGTNRPW
jgi:hypothetical protein